MKQALPLLIAALVASCSGVPVPKADIIDPGQLLFNGYVRKDIDCYTCHSGDASGTWKGANLIGIGKKEGRDEIIHAIRSGPSIMPAYEDDLTSEEIDVIADWITKLE